MALANNINKQTKQHTKHIEYAMSKNPLQNDVTKVRWKIHGAKIRMICQKFSPIYCILCSTAIPKKLSLILTKLGRKKKHTTTITIIVYITMYLFRLTSFFVSLFFHYAERTREKERESGRPIASFDPFSI